MTRPAVTPPPKSVSGSGGRSQQNGLGFGYYGFWCTLPCDFRDLFPWQCVSDGLRGKNSRLYMVVFIFSVWPCVGGGSSAECVPLPMVYPGYRRTGSGYSRTQLDHVVTSCSVPGMGRVRRRIAAEAGDPHSTLPWPSILNCSGTGVVCFSVVYIRRNVKLVIKLSKIVFFISALKLKL